MGILLAILNEIYRRFLIIWNYKFNLVMQLVMVTLIFLGATFFLGHGQIDPAQAPTMLLGYGVWCYARIILLESSYYLTIEAQSGTLEQMYMSPVNASVLLVGRMFAMLISTTLTLILPLGGLALLLHIHLPLNWGTVPVLFLSLVGLFGLSLILCGAVLVFKQVDNLSDLIQNSLLFLAGTLVPLSSFPGWLATISRLLPLTQGIVILREITLGGQSLGSTLANGSLSWLIIQSLIYLCLGWVTFKVCEKVAMRQGLLGQY
jgi:ABC-2 type transport system permease protein